MSAAGELDRLRQQVADAAAALEALLERRQAALDGAGLCPHPKEIQRAQARLEAAEALLRTHERMARI